MGMLQEFKEFAMKGNVVDLAVGVVIGGAFGKIVTSLVNDVIMPPLGLVMGQVDFSDLKVQLQAADPAKNLAEVSLGYGKFLNNVVDFIIVAFAIFMVVKLMNSLQRQKAAAPPPAPPADVVLLGEIRDLLKKR